MLFLDKRLIKFRKNYNVSEIYWNTVKLHNLLRASVDKVWSEQMTRRSGGSSKNKVHKHTNVMKKRSWKKRSQTPETKLEKRLTPTFVEVKLKLKLCAVVPHYGMPRSSHEVFQTFGTYMSQSASLPLETHDKQTVHNASNTLQTFAKRIQFMSK